MTTWTNEKHEDVRGFAVVGHLGHTNYAVVKEAFGYLNAALDEIERLRALTTITDDMVGRAHAAVVEHLSANAGCVYAEDEGPDMLRAALEATLNPKEDEA